MMAPWSPPAETNFSYPSTSFISLANKSALVSSSNVTRSENPVPGMDGTITSKEVLGSPPNLAGAVSGSMLMCSLLLLFVHVSVFAYKSSIPLNEDTIDPRLDDSDKNCRALMFTRVCPHQFRFCCSTVSRLMNDDKHHF